MSDLTTKLCPWLTGYLADLEQASNAGRLGHGWVFAGPAGTGKLNLAMVFAGRLLRRETGQTLPEAFEPEGILAALDARSQPHDHHPDLHLVWPEEGKRSIGIDRIRAVIERISLTGYSGSSKVVIIEPAEWMTVPAANALLKSLEEPSGGTHLILVSHCIGRLPATIRSRCQTLSIRRPETASLRHWFGARGGRVENPLVSGVSVGPVLAARRIVDDNFNKYNKLDDIIQAISESRLDAGTALESCRGLEPGLMVEWITERTTMAIRHRAAAHGTNSITDVAAGFPDNRLQSVATERLFEILDETVRLRDQLGTGLNEQLALEVVLSAFAAH